MSWAWVDSAALHQHLSLLFDHLGSFSADLSRAGSPFYHPGGRGGTRSREPRDADAGLITVGELDAHTALQR
jgi:hypothetical protein